MKNYDVIVVGGGLFGVSIALKLAENGRVLLIEKNSDILTEASFINQNRVHFGFHYPRSFETALESLDGYELFRQKFHSHMRSFDNYYGIVSQGSLTSPSDFLSFASKLKRAKNVEYQEEAVDPWFLKPGSTSVLLRVYEPTIDMENVREMLRRELKNEPNITLQLDTQALTLDSERPFVITTDRGVFRAEHLVNASFGNLCWHNHPNASKTEVQLVEMVEVESKNSIPGITLMDGPGCFGILPLGNRLNRYWWYSVAYSVHMRTETRTNLKFRPPLYSNWDRMKIQGESAFPFMNELRYVRSHYTPRTLLLSQQVDQTAARPSVVTEISPRFYQVLSGKLTTCLKVADEVSHRIYDVPKPLTLVVGDGTHIKRRAA